MNVVISVASRVATPPSDAVIVCGNSDYTLTFDFDAEWAAEPVKIARYVWFSRNKAHSEEITFEGNTVAVPILSNTNAVYVGVYAGNLRTTTPAKIVCEPSILCYGQDANTNPSDMALIKGQIAELVKALKDISVDPAEIKTAVTEYLAQNPVKESDPTVPEWAKQPKKPTYTADEVGAVASSELSNAVNDALAQAKASGEFDGRDGEDGNDYVLTDDDRNEIAELAAGLVEVPDAPSGGENALYVTVTKSEDGVTTADKTFDEIRSAFVNNRAVFCVYTDHTPIGSLALRITEHVVLPLFVCNETMCAFYSSLITSIEGESVTIQAMVSIGPSAVTTGIDIMENVTKDDIPAGGISVTGATVGQTVKISEVDEAGKPTAWEPADFPSGGSSGGMPEWRLLCDLHITEETAPDGVSRVDITEFADGTPLSDGGFTEVLLGGWAVQKEDSSYAYGICEVNNVGFILGQNFNLATGSKRFFSGEMRLLGNGMASGQFSHGNSSNGGAPAYAGVIYNHHAHGANNPDVADIFGETINKICIKHAAGNGLLSEVRLTAYVR